MTVSMTPPSSPVGMMVFGAPAGRVSPGGGCDGGTDQEREMQSACAELESLFIYYMLQEMRKTVPESSLGGLGGGGDLYRSMADVQMANDIAARGGIGLAEIIQAQLADRLTEAPNGGTRTE